jgi:hypothetical protein
MRKDWTKAARPAAAAGALVLAAFGFGAPGIAHPHEGDGVETRVEKVIVVREDAKGGHRGKDGRVRTYRFDRGKAGENVRIVRIERDGPHAMDDARIRAFHFDGGNMENCEGERIASADTGEDSSSRTRVLICSEGQLSEAQRIEKIERVLERIRANETLSAEHKARVTAALEEAIASMRAAP